MHYFQGSREHRPPGCRTNHYNHHIYELLLLRQFLHSSNVVESKEEGKDQEKIHSSTTLDPVHHMAK